jgi:hypothetical protein
MVAQSSVEASLTIMFTLPSCGPLPFEPELALELVPHATEKKGTAANTSPRKMRDTLEFIFRLLRRRGGLHSFVWTKARDDCAGPRRPSKNSGQHQTKHGSANRVAAKWDRTDGTKVLLVKIRAAIVYFSGHCTCP